MTAQTSIPMDSFDDAMTQLNASIALLSSMSYLLTRDSDAGDTVQFPVSELAYSFSAIQSLIETARSKLLG